MAIIIKTQYAKNKCFCLSCPWISALLKIPQYTCLWKLCFLFFCSLPLHVRAPCEWVSLLSASQLLPVFPYLFIILQILGIMWGPVLTANYPVDESCHNYSWMTSVNIRVLYSLQSFLFQRGGILWKWLLNTVIGFKKWTTIVVYVIKYCLKLVLLSHYI